MKCEFIYSSLFGIPDNELWCRTLKKIPRKTTSLEDFPSLEEDLSARVKCGDVSIWHLVDGETILCVNANAYSCGQENPDYGYFILSDLDTCTEAELKKSFEMMEVDCASENGFIDKAMKKGDYVPKARENIIKHISFMRKALDDNAKVIFSLLNGQERKAK